MAKKASYKSIKGAGIGAAAIEAMAEKGIEFFSSKTANKGLGLITYKAAGKKYGYA